MSSNTARPAKRSRWMDWQPRERISTDLPRSAPTKPSIPSAEDAPRAIRGTFADIAANTEIEGPGPASELAESVTVPTASQGEAVPLPVADEREPPDSVRARQVLNEAGVRKFFVGEELIVGIWSDRDGPEIRAALGVLESDKFPVRYLDAEGIPAYYRTRCVAGEPVPLNVLQQMQQSPAKPWKIRDGLLKAMNWCSTGVSPAEFKAAMLNRLFLELGTSGQPGRITAETVRHGERSKNAGQRKPPSEG